MKNDTLWLLISRLLSVLALDDIKPHFAPEFPFARADLAFDYRSRARRNVLCVRERAVGSSNREEWNVKTTGHNASICLC